MCPVRRLAECVVVAGTLAALPATVHAQNEAKALAEALFQDGRGLLAAGKTHEACAKFAMSQRVEPKLGTLLNLATCHEAEGRTASAWAEFTEAIPQAARANQPKRETFARDHAQSLEPRLSRLFISTTQIDPLTVEIDGIRVDGAVLGTAFPIDPGVHTVVITARGKKSWSTELEIPVGPALTPLAVPELEPAAPSAAHEPGVVAPLPRSATPPVTSRAPPEAAPPRSRTPAWIAFGAGTIAAATGTFFGVRAFAKKDEAAGHCPGDGKHCTQPGLDLYDDAERSATASTVAFGVSLLAVGLGVYALVRPVATAPRHGRARAALRAAPAAKGVWLAW